MQVNIELRACSGAIKFSGKVPKRRSILRGSASRYFLALQCWARGTVFGMHIIASLVLLPGRLVIGLSLSFLFMMFLCMVAFCCLPDKTITTRRLQRRLGPASNLPVMRKHFHVNNTLDTNVYGVAYLVRISYPVSR